MKKAFYCLLIFVFSFTAHAQIQLSDNQYKDLQDYWNDFKHTSSSVFSLDKYNPWEILGYAGLTTVFIFGSDMEMHEEFGMERENGPLGITKALGDVGNLYDKPGPFYFTMSFAGALYASANFFNNQKLLQTTNLMAQSLIITSVFTTALKVIIGRARPHVNNEPHTFRPFNFKFDPDYMSMPSGHTSSIFAMMTVIAKQYESWYVKIPAYTFATSVAVQRMNARKHWLSDLLIGGTIGYLIADAVVKRNLYSSQSLSIQPVFGSNGVGLAFQF